MELTLYNIKTIKRDTESLLTKRVYNYVISRWGDYDDKKAHLHRHTALSLSIRRRRRTHLLFGHGTFLQSIPTGNQCASIRTYERNGTLRSFRTVRRQVGQRRSACTG